MGRLIKKEKNLRSIFIRFVGFMIGFSLLIASINVALFIYATNTKAIQPANYAESAISENRESLGSTPRVTEEMIPDVSEFGVYALDGNYQYGSFSPKTVKSIWEKYQNGESSLTGSRFLYVIPRDNSVLLISYPLSLQFNDPGLRQLEMILLIVILSWNFGKYLGQKILILQSVSKNIENKNLDFDFESSDITEINQVLESLYHMRDGLKASLLSQWKTEKKKSDQMEALAHDIKTPLTIVKGNSELLGETDLNHEQMIYQKYILENSVQMEEYINKLVELSKLDEPQGQNFKRARIKDLVDPIYEQARGMMVKKNIDFVWKEGDLENVCVLADGEKLHRTVINVIGNAVEFTPNQGILTVTVLIIQNELVLTILDTGEGFSPQALQYAKEQFFIADSSRTNHKHHGMGLYIADSIMKQHGGRCELGNTGLGGRVILTLPLLKETH